MAKVHCDASWETGPWVAAVFPLAASQEFDVRVPGRCIPLTRDERDGVLLTLCLRFPWVLKQFR